MPRWAPVDADGNWTNEGPIIALGWLGPEPPSKARHVSRAAAVAHIGSLYRDGKGNPDLAPYPCGDHWHIGHDVAHFGKRIKASLRSGRGPKTIYARNRRTKR